MLANNSILKLPLSMSISSPGGCSFHGPERAERRALQSHQLEKGQAGRAHKSSWYLCNPVMLQVYHTWHCHLHATKHGYHLQNLVIKGRGCKCLPHTREREVSWGTSLLQEVSFTPCWCWPGSWLSTVLFNLYKINKARRWRSGKN